MLKTKLYAHLWTGRSWKFGHCEVSVDTSLHHVCGGGGNGEKKKSATQATQTLTTLVFLLNQERTRLTEG